MLRIALQRLVTWVAFTFIVLAPALARAALVPACEDPKVTVVGTAAGTEGDTDCRAMKDGDVEVVDVKVGALCDLRAASVVAPPRILPITDARLDAMPDAGDNGPVIGPGTHHRSDSGPTPFVIEHAIFASPLVVVSASDQLLPPYLPVTGAVRREERPGIDHPPR